MYINDFCLIREHFLVNECASATRRQYYRPAAVRVQHSNLRRSLSMPCPLLRVATSSPQQTTTSTATPDIGNAFHVAHGLRDSRRQLKAGQIRPVGASQSTQVRSHSCVRSRRTALDHQFHARHTFEDVWKRLAFTHRLFKTTRKRGRCWSW